MKITRPVLLCLILIVFLAPGRWALADPGDDALAKRGMYSTAPAEKWQEALVTGNGQMGALVLGNPYDQRVIYIPTGGKATVALRHAPARFVVEWFEPSTGKTTIGNPVPGGADREFMAPFSGDAVLYLSSST